MFWFLLKFVPAARDWFITLPLPVVVTLSPLFSNKYTASFKPIPTTLGVTEPDVEVEVSGVFRTVELFFICIDLQSELPESV